MTDDLEVAVQEGSTRVRVGHGAVRPARRVEREASAAVLT